MTRLILFVRRRSQQFRILENSVSRLFFQTALCYCDLSGNSSITPVPAKFILCYLQDRIRGLHRDIGLGLRDLQVGRRDWA